MTEDEQDTDLAGWDHPQRIGLIRRPLTDGFGWLAFWLLACVALASSTDAPQRRLAGGRAFPFDPSRRKRLIDP